jgi:ribosome-associated toxin RatA of RatAB toxin-antitoxin module
VHTQTEIFVEADAMTVYKFAATTDRWPEILPHYRWVYVLDETGNSRLVEMAARRDFFVLQYPVRWCAVQTCYPDEPRIAFEHVRGITKGMKVEWLFAPTNDGVRVTITHQLDLKWPLIGGIAANYVIGPVFIENIAGKTLARVKQLAEAEPRLHGDVHER